MPNTAQLVGEQIAYHRKRPGLSQVELAGMIGRSNNWGLSGRARRTVRRPPVSAAEGGGHARCPGYRASRQRPKRRGITRHTTGSVWVLAAHAHRPPCHGSCSWQCPGAGDRRSGLQLAGSSWPGVAASSRQPVQRTRGPGSWPCAQAKRLSI